MHETVDPSSSDGLLADVARCGGSHQKWHLLSGRLEAKSRADTMVYHYHETGVDSTMLTIQEVLTGVPTA